MRLSAAKTTCGHRVDGARECRLPYGHEGACERAISCGQCGFGVARFGVPGEDSNGERCDFCDGGSED